MSARDKFSPEAAYQFTAAARKAGKLTEKELRHEVPLLSRWQQARQYQEQMRPPRNAE